MAFYSMVALKLNFITTRDAHDIPLFLLGGTVWLSNCVPKRKELKQVLAKFKCKTSSANCTVGVYSLR